MIELPRSMVEEMTAHARAGLPNEACGVVAGDDGQPVRVYPMRNADESPLVYRFDGNEQVRVFKDMDDRGWDVWGIFHSHTHTEAYPSPTDREEAHWEDPVTGELMPRYPGARYLILSLAEPDPELRAFTFRDGQAIEEEVQIT